MRSIVPAALDKKSPARMPGFSLACLAKLFLLLIGRLVGRGLRVALVLLRRRGDGGVNLGGAGGDGFLSFVGHQIKSLHEKF
jgi:hypothetical protein